MEAAAAIQHGGGQVDQVFKKRIKPESGQKRNGSGQRHGERNSKMIRKLQKADTRRVMEIWLNGNVEAHPFISREYWESNFSMVQEALFQAEVFVCEIQGKVLGFMGIMEIADGADITGGMDGYLAGIFVDKEYRSHGVGKQLLDWAKRDYQSLSLSVYVKNGRAVEFYKREGFSVAEEGIDEATGEGEYTMAWKRDNEREPEIVRSEAENSSFIHEKLREYNARYMRDSGEFNFHIEENNRIVGGIVADGLGDTLEVEFLYVDEECRGKGIGRRLLEHVEKLARQAGMKRILLNTYSFQAPEFYKKMGYMEILKISPVFDEISQYYFIKEIQENAD